MQLLLSAEVFLLLPLKLLLLCACMCVCVCGGGVVVFGVNWCAYCVCGGGGGGGCFNAFDCIDVNCVVISDIASYQIIFCMVA